MEDANMPLDAAQVTVCDVRFRKGTKTYYFDPNGLPLKEGDHVIIETSRGPEYGFCCAESHKVAERDVVAPLRKVLRLATQQDRYVDEQNRKLEQVAYRSCQEKIEQLGLDMQLVSCECAFDGSKLLFYFTAEERVDFRELVKLLASTFRTRIELRQIGVRDKAKMVGGLGICGRPFCCGQFLNDFAPVSIKMAKTQNLSLNPTKISGTCGRLMCCLKYEQDAYEALLKTSPKADSLVDTPDGHGTITDVNLMKQCVSVRLEQSPEETHVYRNEEIAVLRSGKAKKTDAPVPADLAPISGAKPAPVADEYPRFVRTAEEGDKKPRREHRAAEEAAEPAAKKPEHEHVRTRRHTKAAAAADKPQKTPDAAEMPAQQSAQKKHNGNRRHRGGKSAHKAEAPKLQQPAQPAKTAPGTPAPQDAAAPKKNRSNHWHHHRKPKQGGQ